MQNVISKLKPRNNEPCLKQDLDWSLLSQYYLKHSRRVNTPGFMLGPIAVELKPKAERKARKKLVKGISNT